MPSPSCDHCQTPLRNPYHPVGTRRGMQVFTCERCGLIQSVSTVAYESHPAPSMSCDADRASIKYTKDIIVDAHSRLLEEHAGLATARDSADIGSNRGSMLARLLAVPGMRTVLAVESDAAVTSAYPADPRLTTIARRVEELDLGEARFDLVYCAHTLEHLRSARVFLTALRRALKPGGRAFLAVPNISVFPSDGFVELFIDTHTFHFSPGSFRLMLAEAGLAVLFENTVNPYSEIEVVVTPAPVSARSTDNENREAETARRFMEHYRMALAENRAVLRCRVEAMRRDLAGTPAVFWGGGRIFDALVKIGGLDASLVSCLVDKFLHRYLSEVHGLPVCAPGAFGARTANTPVVICSDGYQDEIRQEAGQHGFTRIYHYTDFL